MDQLKELYYKTSLDDVERELKKMNMEQLREYLKTTHQEFLVDIWKTKKKLIAATLESLTWNRLRECQYDTIDKLMKNYWG